MRLWRLFSYVFLAIFLSACDKSISGIWKFDYTYADRDLVPNYLFLGEPESRIIDYNGVEYLFPRTRFSRRRVILRNEFQEIRFTVNSIQDSVLELDSMRFTQHPSAADKAPFTVELLDIETDQILTPSVNRRTYRMSFKENNEGELVLMLGAKSSTIDEISLYLTCYHCKSPPEVILFIDKNVDYRKFKAVLYGLASSDVNRFSISTKSVIVGEYKGIRDKIRIWEEDLSKISNELGLPVLPPIPSREEYIANADEIAFVNVQQIEDVKRVASLLKEGKMNILVNLDHLTSIADYVWVKRQVQQFLNEIKHRLSVDMFGEHFDNLEIAQKKQLSRALPQIISEIRGIH